MEYPLDIKIEYTNTSEYRECLRNLFKMNKNKFQEKINDIENHNKEKLDDITKDEISYDNNAVILMMEYTFNKTKNIDEFKELYKLAALRMFSEDLTIGQAVLFSYDYLYYYHYCLVEIFNNRFHKDFELYKKLVKLLS
jgi:hypothetical protein